MEALDLARWQFGITTVYHFIFVPLTIGLSLLVAIMHTRAVYAKDPLRKDAWTRMTKFFGSMLIVNFGIGIATGIVQEFQFGMNWSEYARFVGDVFGAPLALEGLAAFFLESVFLGLWIFGWGKLPEKIHLLTIWAVALGTTLSAYFIIAANSFMQHPVGAALNPETGRAELDPSQGSILTVLTNVTAMAAFPHVVSGAWLVAVPSSPASRPGTWCTTTDGPERWGSTPRRGRSSTWPLAICTGPRSASACSPWSSRRWCW